MPSITTSKTITAAGLVAALCLCAGASSAASESGKEHMLRMAGFKIKAADTPEKMAELRKLPPLILIQKEHNGRQLTLYADPTGCGCLYYGDASALAAYRQEKLDSQSPPDEGSSPSGAGESMTQQAATEAEFNWGPFGEDGWGPR
jgi:hypothetical protein